MKDYIRDIKSIYCLKNTFCKFGDFSKFLFLCSKNIIINTQIEKILKESKDHSNISEELVEITQFDKTEFLRNGNRITINHNKDLSFKEFYNEIDKWISNQDDYIKLKNNPLLNEHFSSKNLIDLKLNNTRDIVSLIMGYKLGEEILCELDLKREKDKETQESFKESLFEIKKRYVKYVKDRFSIYLRFDSLSNEDDLNMSYANFIRHPIYGKEFKDLKDKIDSLCMDNLLPQTRASIDELCSLPSYVSTIVFSRIIGIDSVVFHRIDEIKESVFSKNHQDIDAILELLEK
ncbi:hypothetical protein UFOVP1290_353 [uncultured Caudovirales phage]|uniref:Uncharacterized protein n=1 Tax=uncultured Caudovirales phage TaxID=2100421 RepID=A0A6J5RHH7_9CAUD|nr:hypothetical protein UFOVP1290_353 [uncultured Caudovirales phage]